MRPKALVVLALWGWGGAALAATAPPDVQGLLAGVPLYFERNDGQVDSRVRFLARGSGYGLYLTADEAVLALRSGPAKTGTADPEVVRWRLVGANPSAEVAGEELLSGKANYLIGDRAGWHTDVPLYGRVRYADVYPGVSLTYYGSQRQLEYDLELAPFADPRRIRFRIEGAESTRIDDEGRLRIRTRRGEVVQHAPVVYQTKDGVREPVAARFRRFGKREVGFEVARYDRSRPLVIDPKIDFSTYLGGTSFDEATDVALRGGATNMEVYVVGTTTSLNFQPPLSMVVGGRARAGRDIFVVKMRFAAGGLSVVFATYLGGDRDDLGVAIAVDPDQQPVIAAQTDSTDIQTTSTFGNRGAIDVWVAELTSNGSSLVYAARLGGDKDDIPRGLTLDGARDVYVVGLTQSKVPNGFPTTPTSDPPAIQTDLRGSQDGFFSVLVANAISMSYSTYLGGAGIDEANGVVVHLGETYIVGTTDSDDFLLIDPFQPIIGGGSAGVNDAFLTSFTPVNLSRFPRWSTYLGGKLPDNGTGIDVDNSGLYVVGTTESGDFPLQDPYQSNNAGASDAFVTKFQLDGKKPIWSTYLGGTGVDLGHDVAVDSTGHVYVTGTTASGDFPRVRTLPSPNNALQSPSDAFLTNFTPPGCDVEYSTFVGGKTTDESGGLAVLPTGNAVVVGRTDSNDLPVFPPAAIGPQGGFDAFAILIDETDPGPDLAVSKADSVAPNPVYVGNVLTYTVTIRNNDPFRPAHNVRLVDTLPSGGAVTILSTTPTSPVCTSAGVMVTCDFACVGAGQTVTVTIDVRVNPSAFPQIDNQAQIIVPEDPFTPNNFTSITTQVALPADMQITKSDTADPVTVGQTFSYTLDVRNTGPGGATNVVVKDTLPSGVAFLTATAPCGTPVGGVVTCNLGSMPAPSNQILTITVRATSPGVVVNNADVTATEPDPAPGNNADSEPTTVNLVAGAVQFFTVRSSNLENLLEWKNPPLGPLAKIAVYRHDTPCVFEPQPPGGLPIHVDSAPLSNDHGQFIDNVGLANDVTYCYSIFVDINGDGSSYSPPRYNKGRPFDSITGKVRWEFNIGTSSLAPVGNGVGIVHSVATDKNLYAMMKGAVISPGLGGGKWPTGYLPYFITGPSQGRPGAVPISPGPPTRATFLASDDGRVHAIDSDLGSAGTVLWISPVLGGVGTTLLAPPSGSFTMFGATRDLIYIGSRDPAGSQLYGLRLTNGVGGPPDGWTQIGGGLNGIVGPVSGQAAVDYLSHRVYFASREFNGANNKTVWCVDFETGAIVWAQPHGHIDGSLSLKGTHVYAPTNDGKVIAIRTSDGLADWTFNIPVAEGAAKGYVVTDVASSNIYFSTNTRVWKLIDNGASPPTVVWPGGVLLPGPGNVPSIPVLAGPHVWVGGSDIRLHRLNVLDGSPFDSFLLGDPTVPTQVGSPTLDLAGGFVYVGTEAGRVYAIQP